MKKLVGSLITLGSLGLMLSVTASAQGDAAEPVTLEIMSFLKTPEIGAPPQDWSWERAVEDALGIDVNVTWVDATVYATVLTTRAGANDLPDLFVVAPQDISQLAPQGLLANWGPLLEAMPTYVEDHNVTELAPIGTFGGTQYGLVTQTVFPYKPMVSIRQDWLDALGLETPKTAEEFLTVMQAFATQDPDGNGRNDTYGWSGWVNGDGSYGGLEPFFGAFNALGDWRTVGGQLAPVETSPERRQALEFISRMVAAGVMDPDWQTQTLNDFGRKWKAGEIGVFVWDWAGTYVAVNFSPFAEVNPTGELVVIDPPVGPSDASSSGTYARNGYIYATSQKAIDAGKGEAVARLFEWMADDGYYLTSYGQEGECWNRDESGKIVQNFEESCIQQTQLASWSYKGLDEEYQSRYAVVTEHANAQTIDVGNILARSYEYPRTDVTQFAVIPPPSPVIAADMQRTTAENELQFMLGQKSFDEWDDYVATLNGIGLEQYTAEANQAAVETGLIK